MGRRRSSLLWVVALALIVAIQWPMLKGMFYRVTGVPAPRDNIAWRRDYGAALAEARQTGKPVLIDFSASWCPPCQVMKHETWPDRRVGEIASSSYIPLFVDVDDAGQSGAVARYGVSSIPTVVVVDGEGRVLRSGGFMSASEMVGFLKEAGAGKAG